MKKLIFLFSLSLVSMGGMSQVWLEGMAVYSIPMSDPFAGGQTEITTKEGEKMVFDNSETFKFLSQPSWGGGINIRYQYKGQPLIVGFELCYVEYKPTTDLGYLTMFRISPTIEYIFFRKGRINPYLGVEFGIQQPKFFVNTDIINILDISYSNFGVGGRAGIMILATDKLAVRIGAKYVYQRDLPYLDLTLGLAYNLGDF